MGKIREITDLQDFAEYLYENTFGEELKIPVIVNNRLKNTIAWFIYAKKNIHIETSGFLLRQNEYIIADVLIHELTHYYLWLNKAPFDDSDDEFIKTVRNAGACETDTLTNDIIMQCQYTEFIARHKKCNFTNKIYVKKADENYEEPLCVCPKCKKLIRYKRAKDKFMDYVPNKKIKDLVDGYFK